MIDLEDKKIEQDRYDSYASGLLEDAAESLELFDYSDLPFYLQSPYSHYERMIREYIVNEHKVLEIGSGTGNYTGYISSTGADVMATDISSKSLEVASLRYSKNKNIKYQAADMEQLPFSDESFDVICSAGSLSYGSYAKVSKEIKRVLKSGGYFICVDSLNNNPIYSLNRYIHFLRGKRSKSTLINMPKLITISDIESSFEIKDIKFFGSLSWFFAYFPNHIWVMNLSNKFDDFINAKASCFKFVMVARLK